MGEYEKIVQHVIAREYPELLGEDATRLPQVDDLKTGRPEVRRSVSRETRVARGELVKGRLLSGQLQCRQLLSRR